MIEQSERQQRIQQVVQKMVAQGLHRGIIALGLVECECGASKPRKHSFCRNCYTTLPPAMRQALYLPSGSGYEEAYDAAAVRLNLRAHQSEQGELAI
jgi:hypothetical protein